MNIFDSNEPSQSDREKALHQNQSAWDNLAKGNHPLTRPAEDHLFDDPLKNVDSIGWLAPGIRGQRVLCLAAGGGRQAPLYAAAGGDVTVVDLSPAMLELDRQVARERKLSIHTVQTAMDQLGMFTDGHFDLVIHPVSTCYVPDIRPVYLEIARVLRKGGCYISQHKQPVSLQAEIQPTGAHYKLTFPYYQRGPLPGTDRPTPLRELGTQEHLHRWEELLGLMCRAGFVIEDVIEPMHAKPGKEPGTLGHRSQFVAPYVRIKARRI